MATSLVGVGVQLACRTIRLFEADSYDPIIFRGMVPTSYPGFEWGSKRGRIRYLICESPRREIDWAPVLSREPAPLSTLAKIWPDYMCFIEPKKRKKLDGTSIALPAFSAASIFLTDVMPLLPSAAGQSA
jgi:hypothetical protein